MNAGRTWCATSLLRVLILLSLTRAVLSAQVIELKGGSSSLYQSQGGTVLVHGPGFNASAGGGTIGGKFYGGAQLVKGTERSTFILGSDDIAFDLPTDIFDSGHYITGIGAGFRTIVHDTPLYLFLGATSTGFDTPFFEGARAENPAAILFASHTFGTQGTASSKSILSRQFTTIESLAWDDLKGTKFAVAAGIGADHPYAATSLSLTRPRYDLQVAYIRASEKFRRVDVAVPLSSEPVRENVVLTVRPTTYLSFSVGRQNYLTPVYQSNDNVRSSVNQAAVNLRVAGISMAAMTFQSTYGTLSNTATAYTAMRAITTKINAQATYMVSKPDHSRETDSFNSLIQETLSSRWTASQIVNMSSGQTTFGYGGSFLSNFATISADYQTYYVPSRTTNPFEEALILSAQIHPIDKLSLQGDTFVAPDGRLLYTTAFASTISRQMLGSSNSTEHRTAGNMLLRGSVVDLTGKPVPGAAIMIDQMQIYSDSQGIFFVRERKRHAHTLTVLTDQFLEGGLYRVISAPSEIRSGIDDQIQAVIVVQQLR